MARDRNLHVDDDAGVRWEVVSLDDLPTDQDSRIYPQVVDGELLMGRDRDRRWDGSAWASSPADPDGWDVFVEDLTGTLHLTPGDHWWDPMRVVLTPAS